MKRILFTILLAGFTFAASSCIRTSTVVEVEKDGSGSIVSRFYFSPQMVAMIQQLNAFSQLPADESQPGVPDLAELQELVTPDPEELKEDAANFGEGVRYSKHEKGRDEDGWEGYSVVYEFDDIRKIRIDQESVPGSARDLAESSGEEIDGEKGSSLTFELDGDTLLIHPTVSGAGVEGMIDREKLQQAKEMGMKPSQAMQMMAGMTEGMRVSVFVRVADGIAETDADHSTGDLVIVSDADVPEVMADPDFIAFADSAAENPDTVTEQSILELLGKLEGMTVELSETVKVKMK